MLQHHYLNSRCAPASAEPTIAFLSGTSRMPRVRRRRIVVEIVDVSSPKFHNIQQARFSKLLNLKMRKEGGPLSPRRMAKSRGNRVFSTHCFSAICGTHVEACGSMLNSGLSVSTISSTALTKSVRNNACRTASKSIDEAIPKPLTDLPFDYHVGPRLTP
jgi:hypothetical protein